MGICVPLYHHHHHHHRRRRRRRRRRSRLVSYTGERSMDGRGKKNVYNEEKSGIEGTNKDGH